MLPDNLPLTRMAVGESTVPPVPAMPDLMDFFRANHTEWVRRELERFTYKPGFQFKIVEFPLAGVLLSMKCPNTYDPEEMIDVALFTPMFAIPHNREEEFARWLAHKLQEFEIHESREWLKRDGCIYDNPHL